MHAALVRVYDENDKMVHFDFAYGVDEEACSRAAGELRARMERAAGDGSNGIVGPAIEVSDRPEGDPAFLPRARARVLEHKLENDPPAVMSSMRRETCTECGRAVLIRPDGTGYGSALEVVCDQRLVKEHLEECAAMDEADAREEASRCA